MNDGELGARQRGLENYENMARSLQRRVSQGVDELMADEKAGRQSKSFTKAMLNRFGTASLALGQACCIAEMALNDFPQAELVPITEKEQKMALYAPLNPWLIERTGEPGARITDITMETGDAVSMDYGAPDVRRTWLYVRYQVNGDDWDPMGRAYVWEATDELASEVMTALLEHTLTLLRS